MKNRITFLIFTSLPLLAVTVTVLDEVYQSARVLITGFEPFGGYDYNPSGDVAAALAGTCMNYTYTKKEAIVNVYTCFDGWVLPVDHEGSSTVSKMLYSGQAFPYDAVLHLGLEDVAKGLKLETFAINQLADPDGSEPPSTCLNNSDYDQPTGPAAVPDAQCELPTTAHLGRLSLEEAVAYASPSPDRLEKLLLTYLKEAWSRNAGTYYCNETLFRTLQAIRHLKIQATSGALLPALFTHLPTYEYLSLEEMSRMCQDLGSQLAAYSL